MSIRSWSTFVVLAIAVSLALGGTVASWMATRLAADDRVVVAEQDDEEEAAEGSAITEDSYRLPTADDVAALFDAVRKMKTLRPATADETLRHRRKLKAALRQAAERIVKIDSDHLSPAYRWASCFSLEQRVSGLAAATAEERNRFIQQVKEVLEAKVDTESLKLATVTARSLEFAGLDAESAAALEAFLPVIAKSEEPLAKREAKRISAVLRRLNLIGSQMELAGKAMNGSSFDISMLKGKVVLVDFWATWCGPCVASMPGLKKAYAAYKDKGFEIVGVSHDRDREALEGYLKENEIGWINLHDPEENGRPASSEAYGIQGIPTMFLISTDGKVLNATIREDSLMKELEKLLGPPAVLPVEAKEDAAKDSPKDGEDESKK